MRKLHLLALGTLLLAAPLSSQGWDTEFGIQGGFTRVKFTGQPFASARTDVYSIPSAMVLGLYPTAPAAFAILPVADKMALEPGLSFIQQGGLNLIGSFPTIAGASLRLDYALTPVIYGAVGGYTRYAAGSPGTTIHYSHFQFGIEAAAGYRVHLNPQLNGRVEIQVASVAKSDLNLPFNLYSLLFALSTPLSTPKGAGAHRSTPRAETAGGWIPEIGVAAGYSNVHITQGPDLTILSFPGAGASSAAGVIAVPGAPSLFAIFPLNERLALETGFDFTNEDLGALSAGAHLTSFQIAPRADLAFGNRWYGALGPNVHFVRVSGTKTEGVSGVTAAWGYRFHLSGALRGRFELSYGVNAKRRMSFGAGGIPSSVLGLNFGMMMPLN